MIFVTGATGFLGSHLLFELVNQGKQIKALYRDPERLLITKKIFGYYSKHTSDLFNKIDWVQGDILDYYNLSQYLKDIQQVYHTAGMVSFDNRNKARHIINLNNVQGTSNVVNACLEQGVQKLCHVSSIAALGESDNQEMINEEMLWNPDPLSSIYSISKFRGEMEVWRGINEGLNAVIVNPSIIIGPGVWTGPIGQLFFIVHKGLKYYPVGSSGYIDVRDVVKAMIRLTDSSVQGERFILNSENIAHKQYLDILATSMSRPKPENQITPLFIKAAVIFEHIRSVTTASIPRINRKMLDIASEALYYSNNKIRQTLDIEFLSVKQSVDFSTPLFLNEINLTR
jgi:dihydroflavonol-4-reductase